ncbi:MAG: hypothetical protein NZM26_00130 [Patescibacteria group bacterium]|nr:hypothetical protein [Patescibacteria group bacterium]
MNDKPTLSYYFTHQYLRDIVQDYFAFFDSVVRLGDAILKKTLRQTFETLKNYNLSETDVLIEEDDFSSFMVPIGANKAPLLVIKLPKPKNTTEASHVAIFLGVRPVRFFTFELHLPNEIEKQINPNAQTKYLLAEWTKKEHKLLNFSCNDPDSTKFAQAIANILNTTH